MIALGGTIKNMTVPHLFVGLRTDRKTGTVIFKKAEAVKKVFFKEGDVIFASSNLDEDRLGECLLRTGKITKLQYDASVEMLKKTNMKQGAIFVELGFISAQDLVAVVQEQVTQIILSLFAWQDGNFQFDEGPLPQADIISLTISTGNLILAGLRRLEWGIVKESLPSSEQVVRPSTDPSSLFQAAELTDNQKAVLTLIDGRRSIQDICSLSQAGDFYTLKVLYIFLALKMVEVGRIENDEDLAFARVAVQKAVAVEEKPPEPPPAGPSPLKHQFEQHLRDMDGKDHYGVLGVEKSATPLEIQKAYLGLAKLYHPDRHFERGMADTKELLAQLTAKINEAYEALNVQATRSEFEYLSNLGKAKTARKVVQEKTFFDGSGPGAAHYHKGMEDFERGSFWTALDAFRKACDLEPGNGRYFYYQGLALIEMPRKHYDAEESLKKAIKLNPQRADYYIALGNLYLKRGLKSRALPVFQEAVQRDPESEKAHEGVKAAGG